MSPTKLDKPKDRLDVEPDTHHLGEKGSSLQILNIVLEGRRRPTHHQLEQLSLATIYSLLAALMQCLSLGCLCIAISLFKWLIVLQPFFHRPSVIVTSTFGVPYYISIHEPWNSNSTDSRRYYFFADKDEDIIAPVMVTVCLLSLLSGFLAFLLEFVEIKKLGQNQLAVVSLLHIFSGIFITGLVALCCWCLLKIRQRTNEDEWKIFQLKAIPGESFYISLVGFTFVAVALGFSLRSMTVNIEQPV